MTRVAGDGMAIELRGIVKRDGLVTGPQRSDAVNSRQRVLYPPRALGLWEDHPASHDRGLRRGDRRRDPALRGGHREPFRRAVMAEKGRGSKRTLWEKFGRLHAPNSTAGRTIPRLGGTGTRTRAAQRRLVDGTLVFHWCCPSGYKGRRRIPYDKINDYFSAFCRKPGIEGKLNAYFTDFRREGAAKLRSCEAQCRGSGPHCLRSFADRKSAYALAKA